MTNQQLIEAHNYTPSDRQELMSAIALFQLSGLPFTPKGAWQMVRRMDPPPMPVWYKTWKLPIGFRVFEVTPNDMAPKFSNAIQHRAMGFNCDPVPPNLEGLPFPRVCYWVVRLIDYYRLLEVQAEQPELELPFAGADYSSTKPAEPVTWSHATLRLRFRA